jgi:hypothetical protein
MSFRAFALTVMFAVVAGPASAQQTVNLQFNGGQVTLSAQNAPVRTILAEWARLGGATIVNGERVAGPPVTLELSGVPERQALDVLLRSVAGYIVAPRPAGSQGASAFDRIVILPTSVAPRIPAPAAAAASGPRPTLPRPAFIARPPDPGGSVVETGLEAADPQEDPNALIQGRDPRVRPPVVMRPPVDNTGDTPDDDADDEQEEDAAAPDGVAPTPANPFGVPAGSSTTPGVIAPIPQSPTQPQRTQPQRPTPRPTNRVQ